MKRPPAIACFSAVVLTAASWAFSAEPPRAEQQERTKGFVLRSPVVAEGGTLPEEFAGNGVSPPLEWSGVPSGTTSLALIMHHMAPDGIKWYWVLYDIPADVTSLPKNAKGIGTSGNNSVNRNLAYAPPNSKGPGPKKYTITLYALSAKPQLSLPPDQVNREVLLKAIKNLTLASAELNVIHSTGNEPRRDAKRPPAARK